MELGWTPREFWQSTVPEFWCAVDWIAEKNLELEDKMAAARHGADTRRPITYKGGSAPATVRSGGGVEPMVNPDLRIERPNPAEWNAWRESLRAKGF